MRKLLEAIQSGVSESKEETIKKLQAKIEELEDKKADFDTETEEGQEANKDACEEQEILRAQIDELKGE